MALTLEELESLTIDQLKQSLISYSVALDSANTNIEIITNEKNKLIDDEKLRVLNESALLNQKDILEKNVEDMTLKLNNFAMELDSVKNDYSILLKDYDIIKNDNINLKEKLLSPTRDISASKIPEKNNNLVIQTYLIKGWDNISGREEHGGRIFNKVTVVVKLELDRKKLSWNITSELLNINWSKEIDLTDPELTNLISQSSTNSWYRLLKGFLEIPDTIENNFDLNNRYVRD